MLVAGATVLVLAGSAVGIAAAQSTPTPSPAPGTGQQQQQQRPNFQAFLDALAKRLNISTAQLETAMGQARTDVGLPANGPGPFGPGGGHGPGGPGGRGFGGDLNAAAQAIGISADQLRQELSGKSLAQVAQAHGKTATDVATALKNAAHQRIDQEVANGRIQATDAAQRKTQVDQRIDQLVNEVKPQGGPRGFGGPGAEQTPPQAPPAA
ncbi:MAG TPA: hypothetical protein VFG86_10735 [Chloroflexota bacterium]|jgi:hypothetical protein|nr:hypothetical protein [Chloroflexota bacterium]